MDSISDVQANVAARLHEQLQRRTPGTPAYEIAEKALSLVLNPTREAQHAPFLHRSVMRDAARILRRSRARRPEDPVAEPSWLPDRSMPSPEDAAHATEVAAHLRAAAAAMHPAGADCFDGWLAEETLAETAERAGVAIGDVKKLRSRIRELARSVWREAA